MTRSRDFAKGATRTEFDYTATAGQTTFTGNDNDSESLSYTAGQIDVYLNGSHLNVTDDYVATNGTSVVLQAGAQAGDSLVIVAYGSFNVANVVATRDLEGNEFVLDDDGDTTITADTDDQIDIKIAGADDFKFTANNFNILSGSTLTIDSGATITNSGTANGFGGGITQADIWRLTTNITSDTGGVSNFERADNAQTTKLGDGVSFSTPYFSFPETGIYLIQSQVQFAPTNDSDNVIWSTVYYDDTDDSSDTLAECQGSDANTSSFSQCILDVTDTTNDKVYFTVSSLTAGGNVTGNTNANNTCVLFLRLGDT